MFAARECARKSVPSAKLMSSISHAKFGNPATVLSVIPTANIAAKQNEVSIAVKAAAVSNADIRQISGLCLANSRPGVAGTYGIGTVKDVGANVTNVVADDTIFFWNSPNSDSGSWSSEANVAHDCVFKISSNLEAKVAAGSFPSVLSAWAMLNMTNLTKGDVVVLDKATNESALGTYVAKLGGLNGVKVVDESAVEKGSAVKLCIASSAAATRGLFKVLSANGLMVVHQGAIESDMGAANGVQIPVAASIFENKSVAGFDLQSWLTSSCPDTQKQVAAGLHTVHTLLQGKDMAGDTKGFDSKDYMKAIAAVSDKKQMSDVVLSVFK